jgi:predicted PurR-regulated permease PerM
VACIGACLERILPLDPRHTRALILEFRDVGRNVVLGTLAASLAQGILAGASFAVFHVPHAVTWTVVTMIGSFVPVVGTSIGWAPPAVYLILHGHPVVGTILLLWGFLVVMTGTDYLIRPRLVGRKVGHPLLVLVALLGGIEVLGLPGLIVAPVLMSLFVAVLRIYEREVCPSDPGCTSK